MKHAIFLMMILLASSASYASEDQEGAGFAMGMLATGKLTGGCGIFKLQIDFQENTKMTGGTDFIARFWTMEAARLGMTLEEYAQGCSCCLEIMLATNTTHNKFINVRPSGCAAYCAVRPL